jgi:hypothetical protein
MIHCIPEEAPLYLPPSVQELSRRLTVAMKDAHSKSVTVRESSCSHAALEGLQRGHFC